MGDVFDDYKIELSMTARLPIEGDESDYINSIYGEILYYNERKSSFEKCGELRCLFINLERVMQDGHRYFDIMDADSSELCEVAMSVFNSRWDIDCGYLKRATIKALGFDDSELLGSENIVYIQRLEIIHKHRGKGVGIHLLEETLDYLAKVMTFNFFVMKPFPLQGENSDSTEEIKLDAWQKKLALHKLEQNRPKALKKLRTLYANLGFTLVKGTQLMVCPSRNFYE